jgi:hypothetical protein
MPAVASYWAPIMGVLVLLLVCAAPCQARPGQVIIIRHGEKPPDGTTNFNLSRKGKIRAAAIAAYFHSDARELPHGRPTAIFAMGADDKPSEDHSHRPVETVQPLAYLLDMPIQGQFTHNRYLQMVKHVLEDPRYDGKIVLICWAHGVLPNIAKAFGVKNPSPDPWPEDLYDRLWVLDFKEDGNVTFRNLPQKLLFGDSDK